MALTELIHYFNSRNRERYGDHLCPGDTLASIGSRIVGLFAKLNIDSVFQPIADSRSGRLIGHEALLRARSIDGREVAPEALFVLPSDAEEVVFLDRLCRTVHALNFLLQAQATGGDLFLNVHTRHLQHVVTDHGLVFEEILKRCGLGPEQVVFEVRERGDDDTHLSDAIANYRRRGYRIAIDHFGQTHSDVKRLQALAPDIVKLDATLIAAAADSPHERGKLHEIIDTARQLGAVTIAEGIETATHLEIALQAGVDRVQGFLIARPLPACLGTNSQLFKAGLNGVPAQ
jgi:EAL domain-containing protein (putative c-di-GMP-specific phosphodiesterase class I)